MRHINVCFRLQEVKESEDEAASTRYVASQLGLACLASSLSPDEGLKVFVELQNARKCFVLENELHILYQVGSDRESLKGFSRKHVRIFKFQVVPIYAAVSWPNLDWMNYLTIWEGLPADIKRVGELIGVEERFLVRAMRGTVNNQTQKQVSHSSFIRPFRRL